MPKKYKKNYKKKGKSKIAKTVTRLARSIDHEMERKVFTQNYIGVSLGLITTRTAASLLTGQILTNIPQGGASGNRVGTQVKIKGIHFKFTLQPGSAQTTNELVRVTIVRDMGSTVVAGPAQSATFQGYSAASANEPSLLEDYSGAAQACLSKFNANFVEVPGDRNKQPIHVLYDGLFWICPIATAAQGNGLRIKSVKKYYKGMNLNFGGTGTNTSANGSIWVLAGCTLAAGLNVTPVINIESQIMFTDS